MALQYPFTGLPPELAQAVAPFQPQVNQAPGQIIAPIGAPAPLPVPQAPQAPQQPGLFSDLANNPAALSAMLRFAGQVLQPPGPGQSEAGVIGQALAGGAETFMKSRKSEQDTDVKRETIGENKRQDVETNEVEQSLIDYRNSLGAAAGATARSRGLTEAAYKSQVRAQTLAAIQKNYNMTESQAITALDLGKEVDFVNFDDIAARVLQSKAAEAGSFDIEDTLDAQARFAGEGVVGTGTQETDPGLIQKFNASPDEDILLIDNDPDLQSKAIKAVGEAAYYKRLSEAQRNSQ